MTVDEERDKEQATIALVNNILDKKPVCCSPVKVLHRIRIPSIAFLAHLQVPFSAVYSTGSVSL